MIGDVHHDRLFGIGGREPTVNYNVRQSSPHRTVFVVGVFGWPAVVADVRRSFRILRSDGKQLHRLCPCNRNRRPANSPSFMTCVTTPSIYTRLRSSRTWTPATCSARWTPPHGRRTCVVGTTTLLLFAGRRRFARQRCRTINERCWRWRRRRRLRKWSLLNCPKFISCAWTPIKQLPVRMWWIVKKCIGKNSENVERRPILRFTWKKNGMRRIKK